VIVHIGDGFIERNDGWSSAALSAIRCGVRTAHFERAGGHWPSRGKPHAAPGARSWGIGTCS